MSEQAQVIDPTIMTKFDELLALAERNGWNAAINACRERLPPQYSQLLRPLYKRPTPEISSIRGEG